MAYLIPQIYNTDKPVGQGEANLSGDVFLVKSMLQTWARMSSSFAPGGPLTVNSRYDSTLADWIAAFQRAVNEVSSGSPLKVDSKMHPMPIKNAMAFQATFKSGYGSTLFALNYNLRSGSAREHHAIGLRCNLKDLKI